MSTDANNIKFIILDSDINILNFKNNYLNDYFLELCRHFCFSNSVMFYEILQLKTIKHNMYYT